ncbi:MAG: DUF2207 domain-containing protein [Clostridiales bacterium]|nr:DUF2207 domain-containing protein [Clostridiales bacterium]
MAKRKSSGAAGNVFLVVVFIIFVTVFALVAFLPDDDDGVSYRPLDKGMYFESFDVDIEFNDDRSCTVREVIEVKFLESSHGIYVDIPVNSGEKVRNLTVSTEPSRRCKISHESSNKIVRARIGDEDKEFRRHDTLVCNIQYDMITPEHSMGADILAFNAIGGGWTCLTKNANIRMTYPVAPEDAGETYPVASEDVGDSYGIWIGGEKVTYNTEGVDVAWSNGNKTVEISIADRFEKALQYKNEDSYALKNYENVELACKMPDGTLHNRVDLEFLLTLGLGAALVVIVVVLKFIFKNKELTPIVDFYPPRVDGKGDKKRHMLPVQIGKLIDGGCSNEDVTSLIFYWASKGYLAIEEKDGETYFKKLKGVSAVTNYEKKMFDALFSYGDADEDGNKKVAMSTLKGKFASALNNVKNGVNNEYRGKLYKKSGIGLTAGMAILCGLYSIGISVLTSLRVGRLFFAFGGVLAGAFQVLSALAGLMLGAYYHKLGDTKRKVLTGLYAAVNVGLALIVAIAVPIDVMGWLERIIFACALCVPMTLVPFFILRTDYYDAQLNMILGFRNFLRDAEKAQLETLLEDDPQYYYDILPYANVLGVSQIWADKFKDITVEPPTYYYGTSRTVFDVFVITHVMNNVGSTLSVQPKSSGGSFSSHGGGGGHSGGGFSGGSFGGGGGGRW